MSDMREGRSASVEFIVAGMRTWALGVVVLWGAGWPTASQASDWPQWGGRDIRNMVCDETGIPETFNPGKEKQDGSEPDLETTRNVQWVVKVGSETYGNPAVSGGRVFIGTNNASPRNPRYSGDRGILMCLDEATGKFLWQLVVSKLREEGSFNGDFANLGVCSSATVEGDRVYVVTGRGEVLCLDVHGLANGNDGPFQDEGEYVSIARRWKPGKRPPGSKPPDLSAPAPKPLTPDPTDADIIWRYDMIAELDVWPQDATDCSVLIHGDLAYVCTSNGVDKSHTNIPSPQAPSLIALDKKTGALVAVDDADISPRILHGQWSSPSLAKMGDRSLVLFGAGDGFCYAFDPTPAAVPGQDKRLLKTVWKCDCNPPEYRVRDGKRLPYNKNAEGPSEVIGTPVFYNNRVYVTVGQDTRHGPGKGALTCIDATQTGDISTTGVIWRYTQINRSFSTPSVVDGLLFVGSFPGDVHCLNAETGECYWTHSTKGQMMGSTLVVDGKVYAGNAAGKLTVLAASKEKKLLSEVRLGVGMHCTPIVANGTLYIASLTHLFAVKYK